QRTDIKTAIMAKASGSKTTKETPTPEKKPAKVAKAKSPSGKSGGARTGGGKSLVIVESPAKAKTINRYLGTNYVVKASLGHVKDLPQKDLGVDVEHEF